MEFEHIGDGDNDDDFDDDAIDDANLRDDALDCLHCYDGEFKEPKEYELKRDQLIEYGLEEESPFSISYGLGHSKRGIKKNR